MRVETIDPFHESATARMRLAGFAGFRVVEGLEIPAIGWDFSNGIDTIDQVFPEAIREYCTYQETGSRSLLWRWVRGSGEVPYPRLLN